MKTFQKISKEELAKELQWHLEQDKIVQGLYGDEEEEFKGCMMGCAVNSIRKINNDALRHDNHAEQAKYLGLPEWFVYLYEGIFEGLSTEDSKEWVIDCFNAIPITETKNIDQLEGLIKIWIIESTSKNHDNEEVKKAVEQVKQAILTDDDNMLSAARSAAESAARSSESAAWSAARSSESAARSAAWSAARSSESAAWSAAESARSAARSAESAAWSAAESARS